MFLRTPIEGIVRSPADEGGGGPAAPAAAASAPVADAAAPAADAADLLYGSDKPAEGVAKPDGEKPVDGAAKPEAKADGEKPDDKQKPDEAKLKEIPEDGKYEFALPDGIELDQELAAEAMPALKEAGVTREGANKLAAFLAQQRQKESASLMDNWEKTQRDWQDTARKDSEYGGEKFDASLMAANKVITKFGTPELKEYLTASGGGNHPELIRLLARVGNAFSDDKPVGSKSVSEKSDDPVKVLYS